MLLRVSRPWFWILGPLVFLLGARGMLPPIAWLQLFLLSIPYCIFLYGINDVYDYASDALNPRKKMRITEEDHFLIKQVSLGVIIILLLSSLATGSVMNMAGMLLLIVFSYYYSAPPLRFKEIPPLDSLSNGILYFLAPLMLGASFSSGLPTAAYFITVCVMGIHAYATITDYTPDKEAGDNTFAIVYGKRAAALFALLTFVLAIVYLGLTIPVITIYLTFCSVLFLITALYPSEKASLTFAKAIFVGFIIAAMTYLML